MVVSLLGGAGVGARFVFAGCKASVVCFRLKNLSSVGWDSVVKRVGVLCGIVHGAGNAMWMRGGACAAELRLMGMGVDYVCVVGCFFFLMVLLCWLFSFGCGGCLVLWCSGSLVVCFSVCVVGSQVCFIRPAICCCCVAGVPYEVCWGKCCVCWWVLGVGCMLVVLGFLSFCVVLL